MKITTDEQLSDANELICLMMMAEPDPKTAKGIKLRRLAMEAQAYEQRRWPDRKPTPLEARKFRLEQMKPAK